MEFTLFPYSFIERKERTKAVFQKFIDGELSFQILNNDIYSPENSQFLDLLYDITAIFKTQLPKMPKDYMYRQIFDIKHKTLVLIEGKKVIGGICYRPFYEKNFVEIVFCAVDNISQVKGYGGFMMDCFKEHTKSEAYFNMSNRKNADSSMDYFLKTLGATAQTFRKKSQDYLNKSYKVRSQSLYFLTYADNTAIGYFEKNGFTTDIKLKNWIGYIKDYDGGTLMQCKVYWEVNYINKDEFVREIKLKALTKLSGQNNFLKVYPGIDPAQFDSISDIPGFENIKTTDYCEGKPHSTTNIHIIMGFLISDLQNNTNAWPFLQPVKTSEAWDYYNIIKRPIDLGTMEKKIQNNLYKTFKEFNDDFKLMISNCFLYNHPSTTFYKCAENLESYYDNRIKFLKFDKTNE